MHFSSDKSKNSDPSPRAPLRVELSGRAVEADRIGEELGDLLTLPLPEHCGQ
jgi:hypothetical protein